MFDLLLTNATVATMADDSPFGLVRDGAIGIADGKIAWVGPAAQAPARRPGRSAISPARS